MRMSIASCVSRRRNQRGQILPLTVIMLVVLIGITGLAIDVSSALSTQRFERAVADAASLAGAQDLQRAGINSAPGATERGNARSHAMDVLAAQLGATKPLIDYANDTLPCFTATGCALSGTYTVSIRTPAPSCVVGSDCADHPELAVQVTITNPAFGLTFSRVLGPSRWSVSAASVAAIVRARSYGVVTLRPPNPARTNGTDPNEADVFITGGSILNISGDIGSNTNLVFSGTNSAINLTSPGCAPNCDFRAFHYDAYQAWPSPPIGDQIQTLIKDPFYRIPVRTALALVYPTAAAGVDPDPARCAREQAKIPPQYQVVSGISINVLPAANVVCYLPGAYGGQIINNDKTVAVILEPGVYWLDKGLDTSSTVVGGYDRGQPGVALVFKECSTSQCQLTANSADLLALNFGDQYKNPSGTRATAAQCAADCAVSGPVQTSSNPSVLMSLMVVPDPDCYVPTSTPFIEPSGCVDSKNKTLVLPGGGDLWVAGVQYAPTDNVNVKGNTTTTGTFGELIAWTVKYDSSFLNLESAVTEKAGVLRLDRACSPGGTVCIP